MVFRAKILRWALFALCAGCIGSRGFGQEFSDSLAGSSVITGTSALITGSNTNATIEPGEPLHAGKVGGHSLWISWQAPSSGLVTISTAGSSFDTLLDAWILEPGTDPIFDRLEQVAENDDYNYQKTSQIQFGANANQTYQIAVDGFAGAVGDVVLSLNLLTSTNLQPTILQRPGDRALRIGDPLILIMNFVPTGAYTELQWYLNGSQINDATFPSLVIPSLQKTNCGFYSVQVSLGDDNFFSSSIEVQVNSEGQSNVLARDKLLDASDSGLVANGTGGSPPQIMSKSALRPMGLAASVSGVTLGYNGTQIYNTTNATLDPNEPPICGQTGGASYWFSYQAPDSGLMSIDTVGSAIPTLLGVFTYNGPLLNYTNLIPVTCDTNSGPNGSSRVQFSVLSGSNYFAVVDGVNGARGTVQLNYSLNVNPAPQLPVITAQPQIPPAVAARTPVALGVVANGTAPLSYQWWFNNSRLNRATNPTLLVYSPSSQNSGSYSVVVSNAVGAVTSAPVVLNVITSAVTLAATGTNSFVSAFPGTRGYQYAADCLTNTLPGTWTFWTNSFPDYGGVIWLTNTMDYSFKFIRVHSP